MNASYSSTSKNVGKKIWLLFDIAVLKLCIVIFIDYITFRHFIWLSRRTYYFELLLSITSSYVNFVSLYFFVCKWHKDKLRTLIILLIEPIIKSCAEIIKVECCLCEFWRISGKNWYTFFRISPAWQVEGIQIDMIANFDRNRYEKICYHNK